MTSLVIVSRRLSFETWYFVHLYTYLGIALAFSHQLATGNEFLGDSVAQGYWYALYLVTLGSLVLFRFATPVYRTLVHRMRVERIDTEAPGVVSITITGRHLDRLDPRAGQFFLWRFLTRDRWWEAHPFSLSALPDGRSLRITVKSVGDFTSRIAAIPVGTRVIAEGPFGSFTAAARRNRRVALIAGGVGITPIRALLEELPAAPGELALIYRVVREEDALFLGDELDELALRRGAELHYVLGDHSGPGRRSCSRPSTSCASCRTSPRATSTCAAQTAWPQRPKQASAGSACRASTSTSNDSPFEHGQSDHRPRSDRRCCDPAGRLRHAAAADREPELGVEGEVDTARARASAPRRRHGEPGHRAPRRWSRRSR